MKKLGKVVLIACLLMATWVLSPQTAKAATLVDSGTCGTNLKWYVYDDGNLIINGNGAMNDYISGSGWLLIPTTGPWEEHADIVKKVSISEGVTSIGSYAFWDMKCIKEVSVASTVTEIGESAFKNCILLEEVIIPNNVETVGEAVFENCISLEQAYLSGQIEEATKLFYGCTSLKEVAMPKSMSKISDYMFYGCSSLVEIWVDETVTAIGSYAFKDCSEFKYIRYDDTLTQITSVANNAFENCVSLPAIIGSEISIGSEAYKGCKSISKVSFNGSTLGSGAFADCTNLKQAVIGENVSKINSKTFQNDSSLSLVRIFGDETVIVDSTVFSGCSSSLEVKVPDTNTQVLEYLEENGIKRCESTSIFDTEIEFPSIVGGPVDVARWINSNHCIVYSGNKCSTVAIKTEGYAKNSSSPFAEYKEIFIHYSDSENLTEENYTEFPTSITTKAAAGIYKKYAYGEYIDLGVMYCAIAKAEPVLELKNISINEGKTKVLNLSVKGNPAISYKSTNPTVASISASGKITAKKPGTTTIRVYAAPTKNYRAVVKEFKVTVKKVMKKQTITASSKTVAYKSSAFSLNAKASGGGKLTYSSSNKNVATVSSAGKITPKAYGKTTITIKAAAKGNYLAATKKITVKVVPKKMTITSAKSPSKKTMKIKWKKDTTATGYQIYVSTNKNFASKTIKRTFKKGSTSTTLSFLTRNKTYYVKIRAYKTMDGTKYYGAWSAKKSVKIK